jgi:prepilin-type processing-associated H-X9-DG protein
MSTHQRESFTLVELLVVICIISILITLSFPAIQGIKETSRASVCISNMRQLGIGLMAYSADNNGFFPPANTNDTDELTNDQIWQRQTWVWFIRSYCGVKKGGLNTSFASSKNPTVFICPKTDLVRVGVPTGSQVQDTSVGNHCYGMSTGVAITYFGNGTGIADQFPVSRSWVKKPAEAALITENRHLVVGVQDYLDLGLIPHHGGMNVLFYDGHVDWMSYNDIPQSGLAVFWKGK